MASPAQADMTALPPRPNVPTGQRVLRIAAALAVLASLVLVGADPRLLFSSEAFSALGSFGAAFLRPDLSYEFLSETIGPTIETVRLATAGTVLAILLGAPLSLLATSTFTFAPALRGGEAAPSTARRAVRRSLWAGSRLLLNTLRSIPELVWALLFVRALGLGPGPGILALGVAYAGVLGKVYAEILESTDLRPAHALRTSGASLPVAILWGVLPKALPTLVSYGLYRWECAMRAAAVLGFVGAGGLGQHIEISMRMFDHARAATLLLELLVLVIATDALSGLLRRRLR